MFSVLKIDQSDRQALPEKLRSLPAMAVYENGGMTGYCAFRPLDGAVVICGLRAEDPALADAALRAVLANCEPIARRFEFDAEFCDWDMLPQFKLRSGGEIEEFLHCCG